MKRRDLSRDLWHILFHVGIKLQHLSIQCHVGRCELAVSRCEHVILLLKAAHLSTVNATQARTTSLHHRPMLIHSMRESQSWGGEGAGAGERKYRWLSEWRGDGRGHQWLRRGLSCQRPWVPAYWLNSSLPLPQLMAKNEGGGENARTRAGLLALRGCATLNLARRDTGPQKRQ
jgi:hypothetical protein